jgi:hypothetical protein
MAFINGATSPDAIIKAWKMSFWPVMRVSSYFNSRSVCKKRTETIGFISGLSLANSSLGLSRPSQWRLHRSSLLLSSGVDHPSLYFGSPKLILPRCHVTVPFFTSIGATVGCFINVQAKKKALIARAKAQAARDAEKAEK